MYTQFLIFNQLKSFTIPLIDEDIILKNKKIFELP